MLVAGKNEFLSLFIFSRSPLLSSEVGFLGIRVVMLNFYKNFKRSSTGLCVPDTVSPGGTSH